MTHHVVSQLMQRPVLEIDPEADVEFVLQLAQDLGVHYFPLVRGSAPIGIVCRCDLDHASLGAHVKELVHRTLVTVSPGSTISDAAELLLREAVGSAVVMDGEYMCGLLTRDDITRTDQQMAQRFAVALADRTSPACDPPRA